LVCRKRGIDPTELIIKTEKDLKMKNLDPELVKEALDFYENKR